MPTGHTEFQDISFDKTGYKEKKILTFRLDLLENEPLSVGRSVDFGLTLGSIVCVSINPIN